MAEVSVLVEDEATTGWALCLKVWAVQRASDTRAELTNSSLLVRVDAARRSSMLLHTAA
jgi:hypothetical protein